MSEFTSISLSRETKERLDKYKKELGSYDKVIISFLNETKERKLNKDTDILEIISKLESDNKGLELEIQKAKTTLSIIKNIANNI